MAIQTTSTLSNKRIYISMGIFISTAIIAHTINIAVQQYDISLMFALNLSATILIMYNWNLFGIHYNRAKYNLTDTMIYVAIAFVITGLWTYLSNRFLHCIVIIPPTSSLIQYGYARIGMLIAYSFSESAVICITQKCATDHMQARHHELQTILLSGMLLGILVTIVFFPSFNILTILTTLLYNVVMCTIFAYLYNQTHSFIAGMLGFAGSNLLFMLLAIL